MPPDVYAAHAGPPTPPKLKRVHHVAHAILSVVTGGMWLFVWAPLIVLVSRENKRRQRAHSEALRRYAAQMASYHDALAWRQTTFPGARII